MLIPLAMNLNLPVEQWLTYTWRSTAIDARAGSSAVGAPVGRYGQLTGLQGFDPTPDPMGGPPTATLHSRRTRCTTRARFARRRCRSWST